MNEVFNLADSLYLFFCRRKFNRRRNSRSVGGNRHLHKIRIRLNIQAHPRRHIRLFRHLRRRQSQTSHRRDSEMPTRNRGLQMDGHWGVSHSSPRPRVEQVLPTEASRVREAQHQGELLPRHPPGPQQVVHCLFGD